MIIANWMRAFGVDEQIENAGNEALEHLNSLHEDASNLGNNLLGN